MTEPTFYHATWIGNVPSIKEKGLVAKTLEDAERTIDSILAEYGETRETVPKYYWYYPLLRLQETAGKVHLSGDKQYAMCNCLAGFEAEVQLRSSLEAKEKHKKMRHLTPEEALKREMPCSVCEVKLKENEIPEDEIKDIRERAKHATQYMPEKFPTEQDAFNYIMSKTTIVLNHNIPPDKIKKCEHVGRKEDFEKCHLTLKGGLEEWT